MQRNRRTQMMSAAFALVLSTALLGGNASGITGQSVFFFNYLNGTGFGTGLTVDASGNIWGTSPFGGAYGYGNVFELTRNATGEWTETVLYSFTNGSDGGIPNDDDGPLIDSEGNLYGTTTQGGGANYGGTVFKLTHSSNGWQESVLWTFTCGNDGCAPDASLVSDSAGNLYGTAFEGGGSTGFGTVFELTPPPDGSGSWSETTLYTFSGGRGGGGPQSALTLDQSGNLYGSTSYGGYSSNCVGDIYGCGVIFELSQGAGRDWNEQVLYAFRGGKDGAHPDGKLVLDASGSIYGANSLCGDFLCSPYGDVGFGTVFRLTPPTSSGGQWSLSRLHAFTGGSDGGYPSGGLIVDKTGVVYGTALEGGNGKCGYYSPGCGTVYRIAPTVSGRWDFDVMYSFSGTTDGGMPFKITLAGSTAYIPTGVGGSSGSTLCSSVGCGTIFQLSLTNQ
jgi:uncharacterized repeat protein (TIGR03803 family)